ncbi:MAG: hypothetical protein Q8P54_03045 [bacterium]|nr:hypothetical protein [bacterium]
MAADTHVWLDVRTVWGETSIQLKKDLYDSAIDGNGSHRDHICIKVRENLIRAGASIYRVEWGDLAILDVRTAGESSQEEEPPAGNFQLSFDT